MPNFNYDFTGLANGVNWPDPPWTRVLAPSWGEQGRVSVFNETGRIDHPNGTFYGAAAAWITGETFTDESIQCDVQVVHTDTEHAHISFRQTGTLSGNWPGYRNNGYALYFDMYNDTLGIEKLDNYQADNTAVAIASTAFAFATSVWYRVRIEFDNTNPGDIDVWVWDRSQAQPVSPTLSVNDTAWTSGEISFLGAGEPNYEVYYDNILVEEAAPITVTWLEPAENATLSGTVELITETTDPSVDSVRYKIGETILTEAEGIPEQTASIQTMIDEAPSGGTVTIPYGIYRQLPTVNKPLTLTCEPGTEIRGSDVWTEWTASGGAWVSTRQVPNFGTGGNSGECHLGDLRCERYEQVFVDDVEQSIVASSPGAGEFSVNGDRTLTLGTDPSGKKVEVTTRQRWLHIGSDNVTIDGLHFRHAGSVYNDAALMNTDSNGTSYGNLTVTNCILEHSASQNVKVQNTTGNLISNSEVRYGEQAGINAYQCGLDVDNVHIHHNNPHQAFNEWASGGFKGAYPHATAVLNVTDCEVNNNEVGGGIWFDVWQDGGSIARNRVHHNSGPGIWSEISANTLIEDNVIWENGYWYNNNHMSAGLLLADTNGCTVRNNIIAWNNQGMVVFAENRENQVHDAPHARHDNYLHDNDVFVYDSQSTTLFASAWFESSWGDGPPAAGDGLDDGTHNNRGENNRYFYRNPSGQPNAFRWIDQWFDWTNLAGYSGTPGENNGVYLTEGEKDTILSAAGVPLEPEARA